MPVVCTAVDGLVELLGDHAYYADDTSYEAFRDAMRRWLSATEDERAAVARAARTRHLELYTDVTMARAYARCFNAVATDRTSGLAADRRTCSRGATSTAAAHQPEASSPLVRDTPEGVPEAKH